MKFSWCFLIYRKLDLATIFQEQSCCVSSDVTVLCLNQTKQAQQKITIRLNFNMILSMKSSDKNLPGGFYPASNSRYCVDPVG